MNIDPSVKARLEKETAAIQKQFQDFCDMFPQSRAYPLMLAVARCGNYEGYVDHLFETTSLKKHRHILYGLLEDGVYQAMANGISPLASDNDDRKALGKAICEDLQCDAKDAFPPLFSPVVPGLDIGLDQKTNPRGIHENFGTTLAEENETTQALFYDLKNKTPRCSSDWLLLFIAWHARDGVPHPRYLVEDLIAAHPTIISHAEANLALDQIRRIRGGNCYRPMSSSILRACAADVGGSVETLFPIRKPPRASKNFGQAPRRPKLGERPAAIPAKRCE